jgi:hypothetical protein
MSAKVFLVHGWSVKETTTYQALHEKLGEQGFDLKEIRLGRYVSLDNEVEVRDIARAMHNELMQSHCLGRGAWNEDFHIITHSTGALVVKHWIVHHYIKKWSEKKPLKNVVFLAGPHFGSRLAHHGRSMLAHAAYGGDTGKEVLGALELGSRFSWENNGDWLDGANWKKKGIRPYCLIGDKVKRDFFKSRIFPAGYEKGSDMVVRVPAGNLNFRRYRIHLATGRASKVGEIEGVPFGALANYTHSGPDTGIMNSIKRRSRPGSHQALKLILQCLKVKNKAEYEKARADLAAVTRRSHKGEKGFAQLDFRFRDEEGMPVKDYSVVLGAKVNGENKASRTVVNTHKNQVDGSCFTVFINLKEFEPRLTYYLDLTASTDTPLVDFTIPRNPPEFKGQALADVICEDRTTQIDVVVGRLPKRELFVFHVGDDSDLHVRWNRRGEVDKTGLPVE